MPSKVASKSNAKAKGKSSKNDDDEPYIASKGAKLKKDKDPNMPKRPQSAYF